MRIVRLTLLGLAFGAAATAQQVAVAPNGIEIPAGWEDWRIIAPSHRTDNNTLRVILGNDVAIEAARAGQTNPWPDGAILGKIVWRDAKDANWEAAQVPGDFVHVEFMIKDAERFKDTVGWGFARWRTPELAPFGADANFAQECVACHTPVEGRDYVFTTPAVIPIRK